MTSDEELRMRWMQYPVVHLFNVSPWYVKPTLPVIIRNNHGNLVALFPLLPVQGRDHYCESVDHNGTFMPRNVWNVAQTERQMWTSVDDVHRLQTLYQVLIRYGLTELRFTADFQPWHDTIRNSIAASYRQARDMANTCILSRQLLGSNEYAHPEESSIFSEQRSISPGHWLYLFSQTKGQGGWPTPQPMF